MVAGEKHRSSASAPSHCCSSRRRGGTGRPRASARRGSMKGPCTAPAKYRSSGTALAPFT
eukprot:4423280-Pleurochrysis_carterae.AAC.3